MKNKFILFCLIALMILMPIYGARYLLKTSRLDSYKGDAPNYLSHQKPPASAPKVKEALHYELNKAATVKEYVPRVFMVRLPESLPSIVDVKSKKKLFTSTMLPLILRSNELILNERAHLKEIQQKLTSGKAMSKREAKWIKEMIITYRISKKAPKSEQIKDLLDKVDIIPASLALAQAAIESGWGTSYFAQKGNALFGQWVWGDDAKGILPRQRNEGATHKIKAFDYLLDSVSSYMVNLNRHQAYQGLRDRRTELRRHGLAITGSALAPALIKYSERGADYVSDLLLVISYNKFTGLDNAELEKQS